MPSRLRPGSLKAALDLFEKARRDGDTLRKQGIGSDAFFNFVVTSYSLIDWVKADPAVPPSAKTSAAIHSLYTNPWLRLCGDCATGAKHFSLSSRVAIADKVSVAPPAYGSGRYGMGAFGVGEEVITVHLQDGTVYTALELVAGVLETWETFFKEHGIAPPDHG